MSSNINLKKNTKCIYELYCQDCSMSYIGSTKCLYNRLINHKSKCKKKIDTKLYNYINIKGWDKWNYRILKKIKRNITKKELHKIERYFIENKKDKLLNKQIPTRTIQEYRITNIDKVNLWRKRYLTKNRLKLLEKKAVVHTCLCGRTYTHGHKKRHLKTKYHKKHSIINILKIMIISILCSKIIEKFGHNVFKYILRYKYEKRGILQFDKKKNKKK